ncbi:DUF421 domain-containing protein [Flavobacterium terrigena]|uniref:YetF C-terminal domain-containing protein n=1 Tax=Flavobacterium terrigena TaxID=402734 RepID=A0A1H6R7Y8_9FLAO|nr:YetF domain-containing protein [Flavobacterium terrigena]SEI47292.1 Protein of unknown function [Flavobacterium terrigena]
MIPYLDIVVRSICVYFFMVIALRIFGKKELSQLNASDIVLILLISNAVQNAMVGSDVSLEGGIVAAFSLFLINYIFKKIINKSPFLSRLVQSKPEILIHDGKIDFNVLSKLDITSDELDEVIREHGVDNYKHVKLAMLELNGSISIISGKENLRQTRHKRIHKTLGEITT